MYLLKSHLLKSPLIKSSLIKLHSLRSPLNLSLLFSALVTLSACSTQQEPISDRAQACVDNLPNSKLIKKQGVTTGCVVTAALWKAIGQDNPASLVCLAGGTAGLLLGTSVAERKCNYRIMEEQIDGEIAHAKKMNLNFVVLLAHKATEFGLQETKVASLLAQKEAGTASLKKTNSIKKEITETADKERYLVSTLLKQVAFKRKTLDEAKKLNNSDKTSSLHNEIKLLYKNIKLLQKEDQKLFKLENKLSGL